MATRRLKLAVDQSAADRSAADQAAELASELAAALADGARAQYDDGDLRASRQHFDRAYQLAERAGDVQAMALAALGLAGLWVSERRTVTGAVQQEARLEHVLALLDPDSRLALRIRARLAGEADYLRGGHEAILAALGEARAAADPELLAEALSMAHHCLLGPDHVALRRELAVELIKASFRTERRSDLLMGLLWQTVDSYSEGDPHAGRQLGELRDHLGAAEPPGRLVRGQRHRRDARDPRGPPRRGGVPGSGCAASGAAAGDIDHGWWSGAQLVTIRWYQGRLGELLPALHEQVHSPELSAVDNSAVAALAVAAALSGDRRTAASSLEALCGADLGRLPRSSSWLVTMDGVVEAAYLLGHADVADAGLRAAQPVRQPADGRRPRRYLLRVGSACARGRLADIGAPGPGRRPPARGRAAQPRPRALARGGGLAAAARAGLPAPRASGGRRARRAVSWTRRQARRRRWASRSSRPGRPRRLDPAPRARSRTIARRQRPRRRRHRDAFAQCRRVGRKWRLTWQDRSVLVEDSIGMAHLAVLIANPRQEILAADLAAGLAALRPRGRRRPGLGLSGA